MTKPRLAYHQLPGWPRRMARALAAAYCGVSPTLFDGLVRKKKLPPPIQVGSLKLWDRLSVDKYLDGTISGFANCPDEEQSEGRVKNVIRSTRARRHQQDQEDAR